MRFPSRVRSRLGERFPASLDGARRQPVCSVEPIQDPLRRAVSNPAGEKEAAMSGALSRTKIGAVALVLAGVVSACSSSGGGSGGKQSIRFVWWGNQDRATATQQAVALFEKKYPNIKVSTEFSSYTSYVQKLTTQIVGGGAPDVIQLDRPTFGEYVQKHALDDLTPYVGKSLNVSGISSELLSGEKADGD